MSSLIIQHNVNGIEGLCLICPAVYRDERGYFTETYSQRDLADNGITAFFVQDGQSKSHAGVLRGLHFQKMHPQAKLVRAVIGSVYDVAVDLRKGSLTYGKWFGIELTEENHKQLFIPRGFAHGYLALSENATVCYKYDDFYYPEDEGGVAWNDIDLNIEWPEVKGIYQGSASGDGYTFRGKPLLLSIKDQQWTSFKNLHI